MLLKETSVYVFLGVKDNHSLDHLPLFIDVINIYRGLDLLGSDLDTSNAPVSTFMECSF